MSFFHISGIQMYDFQIPTVNEYNNVFAIFVKGKFETSISIIFQDDEIKSSLLAEVPDGRRE